MFKPKDNSYSLEGSRSEEPSNKLQSNSIFVQEKTRPSKISLSARQKINHTTGAELKNSIQSGRKLAQAVIQKRRSGKHKDEVNQETQYVEEIVSWVQNQRNPRVNLKKKTVQLNVQERSVPLEKNALKGQMKEAIKRSQIETFISEQIEKTSKQRITHQSLLSLESQKQINQHEKFTLDENKLGNKEGMTQLRFILNQVMQINAIKEVEKYRLQHRVFEILAKLQSQVEGVKPTVPGDKPIEYKKMTVLIQNTVPTFTTQDAQMVYQSLFRKLRAIGFTDFVTALKSTLSANQVSLLSSDSNKVGNVMQELALLFSVTLQIKYFERELKGLLQDQLLMSDFTNIVEKEFSISHLALSSFLHPQEPMIAHLKAKLYLESLLGLKPTVYNLEEWLDGEDEIKSVRKNQFKNTQHPQHFA